MNKKANKVKKTDGGVKQYIKFNRKTAIIFLAIFTIAMILAYVFAFTPVQIGTKDYNPFVPNIKLGLDLEGGVYASYDSKKPSADMTDDEFKASIDGTVKVLESLLFSKGFSEAQVTTFGDNNTSIRVEVPNASDDDEIFALISDPKKLEFFETDQSGTKVNANAKAEITGDYISNADVVYDSQSQEFLVSLKFNKQGSTKFAEITTRLQGKYLGIFLGGELLMSPKVEAIISNGQATIDGNYTKQDDAYKVAVQIQSGAMPVELTMRESGKIGAYLGASAKTDGLIAGVIGIVLIMIFMCFRYRLMGVAASLSLIFFTVTYLFFMSIFPWVQLTLPGIAGILLSIGMAVDANVIIFERVKEERSRNNNINDSIAIGFKRSYSAILDGNITTIIGAVVLILLAAATIKGFAITLLIGIIISLFSSLVVTRIILKAIMAFNSTSDKLYGTSTAATDYTIFHKNIKKSAKMLSVNKTSVTDNQDSLVEGK